MKILTTMMGLVGALLPSGRKLERRPGNPSPAAAKPGSWKPSDPLAACCGVYDGETRFAERDPRLAGLRAARRKGWVVLTYDTTPGYLDTTPFPAALTKWKYRAIYRVDDHQVGQWSAEVSVNVGG